MLFIQPSSQISHISKWECPNSRVWFFLCLFLSMPLLLFFFLCFTKEFSSSVENVWLLPVEFCVASQLCVFVSSGGRRIWLLPLGASKPNTRSFLFSLSFESSVTSRFFSRSSVWGSGFHWRCSTLCRRHSASFHSFVLTERFGFRGRGSSLWPL